MELWDSRTIVLGIQLILFAFGYGILWTEVRNLRYLVHELKATLSSQVLLTMRENITTNTQDIAILKSLCEQRHGDGHSRSD